MKVKIFASSFGLKYLENKINDFLNIIDKEKIRDIKIQTSGRITVALIMYESDMEVFYQWEN